MKLSDCDFVEIVAGISCQALCTLAGWKVGEGRAHGPRHPLESSLTKNTIHQIISIPYLKTLTHPNKNFHYPHQPFPFAPIPMKYPNIFFQHNDPIFHSS